MPEPASLETAGLAPFATDLSRLCDVCGDAESFAAFGAASGILASTAETVSWAAEAGDCRDDEAISGLSLAGADGVDDVEELPSEALDAFGGFGDMVAPLKLEARLSKTCQTSCQCWWKKSASNRDDGWVVIGRSRRGQRPNP